MFHTFKIKAAKQFSQPQVVLSPGMGTELFWSMEESRMHLLPVTNSSSSKEVADTWKSQDRWLLQLHHRWGPGGGRRGGGGQKLCKKNLPSASLKKRWSHAGTSPRQLGHFLLTCTPEFPLLQDAWRGPAVFCCPGHSFILASHCTPKGPI